MNKIISLNEEQKYDQLIIDNEIWELYLEIMLLESTPDSDSFTNITVTESDASSQELAYSESTISSD